LSKVWAFASALAAATSLGAGAQSVTVVKSAFPSGDVGPGDVIDYTVVISNPFGFDLGIGFFQDFIPDNTSFVPDSLTLDPFVPDVLFFFQGVVFNTGDLLLPAFGSTTVEFSVQVDSGVAPGTQIVNVAHTDHGDSNFTVNTVTARAEIFSVLDVDPPGVIGPGEVLTYTITSANFGFSDATGIEVIGPIPALTTYVPGSAQLLFATSGTVGFDSGNNRVVSGAGGIGIAAQSPVQIIYQVRVQDSLPDETAITNTALVDGVPTNTVRNFTVTLSDYIDLEAIPGNVLVTDLNPFDATGWAMAGGDFDDDFSGDLIIGDPTGNDEGFRSGTVHIVYGGLLLTEFVTLPASGAATTVILPPAGTRRFGNSLATGDFTGDGVDDILIGAPGATSPAGPGQVFLIEGGAFTPLIDLNGTDSPRTVFSGVGSELLGWGVAGGDFNGDGVQDAILGAPNFAPNPGDPVRGRVVIVPGGSGLPPSIDLDSPAPNISVVVGDPADLGIASTTDSLAAGDVDGDGLDDVVIGSALATTPSGSAEAGKLFIVGGTATPITHDLTAEPQGWVEVQSEFPEGRMGWSVAVGDLNGDAFADIAVGAPEASWLLLPDDIVYSYAGVVFGLLGRSDIDSGTLDLASQPPGFITVFGEASAELLGADVAFGDHNGDGFDELLMGGPFGRNSSSIPIGVTHVVVGTPRLRRQYLLPFAPTGTLRFFADDGSEAAFQTLETGDLNSDGFADLFLGDTVFDPLGSGATDGDEIHIFFGKPRAPRLELAVVSEFGEANRVLNPGEQLILQFDQSLEVASTAISDGDFFLTNVGATLGAQATLSPNPNDQTQAIITLGADFQGIVVDGDLAENSTRVDIGANTRRGLIVGAVTGLPAEDTGIINSDDRGVDLVWGFETISTEIMRADGGSVTVSQNADFNRPDFAYTGHGLEIPAGALTSDTVLAVAGPPSTLRDLNLRTAVQITENDPGVPTFAQPATLTLEYRDEDLAFTPGAMESLFRIYQVVGMGGPLRPDNSSPGIRLLGSGQELRLVSGPQMVDTSANTVSVSLSSLDPEGSSNEIGVFATLPINPVEERSIDIAATGNSGAAAATPAQLLALVPGPDSHYALHRVEFPGFATVPAGQPGSIRVTMRTANLFERSFPTGPGANIFPTQSGAIFAVDTRDASGTPTAFTSPVNVRVQYIPRPGPEDTDVVDLSGVVGDAQRMRIVHSEFSATNGTDFKFVERPQGVDLALGTVSVEGLTGLTGPSGTGVLGAVIDTRIEAVTVERIVDSVLGRITLTPAQRSGADINGDAAVDVADVVALLNAPGGSTSSAPGQAGSSPAPIVAPAKADPSASLARPRGMRTPDQANGMCGQEGDLSITRQ
jgi:uncharacterized repeat protein (TIGR01451 family)